MSRKQKTPVCPICGADLSKKSCQCRPVVIDATKIPKNEVQRLAALFYASTLEQSGDPEYEAEFDKWMAAGCPM